jgi:predicted nucleic acid-binding protein
VLFLLDTNTFSDLMFGPPKTQARLAAPKAPDEVTIFTVVRGEILFGIESLPLGRRRTDLETKANQLFATIPFRSVPDEAADRYATLRVAGRKVGANLSENDFWIAAAATVWNAVLVTGDKDFSNVPGLQLEDWSL